MSGKTPPLPMLREPTRQSSHSVRMMVLISLAAAVTTLYIYSLSNSHLSTASSNREPANAQAILAQCSTLQVRPGPTEAFWKRDKSDRYEPGTNATLIKNCNIMTGERNGTVVVHGSLLLDKGIVKGIGRIPHDLLNSPGMITVDADGAWVTPGLVDLNSHIGLASAPFTAGSFDLDSKLGPVLPWLRSVDGFDTHDDGFELAIAGGVTSVQVLPGSANAIGGQAFMMKLRKTSERSVSSMLIEPPFKTKNPDDSASRWRHLKQACGEELRRYGGRMDTVWAMRNAYNQARKLKQEQDDFCVKAQAGLWDSVDAKFPQDYKWEMLVDVLRGRVKVSNQCYEAVDIDNMVRLSNEFEFPIASFHHASEAYLVPDVIKRTWGGVPTVALSATSARDKRETFRASEFAPRVLSDNGIPVAMKSDHPIINSRYLIYEAQQAHYFSLSASKAFAAVTSVPATAVGLSHRIGILKEGVDADVVIWDSHPLQLGATPVRVWIDGVAQIPVPSKDGKEHPVEVGKGKENPEWRRVPASPDWDQQRKEAILWEGLPPLGKSKESGRVVFRNVSQVWLRDGQGMVKEALSTHYAGEDGDGVVVVERGNVVCMGGMSCLLGSGANGQTVDLQGGAISPGLMSFGSQLGVQEIQQEPSTGDGMLYDAFTKNVPAILHDVGSIARTMDALTFSTRNALVAYHSGVTSATTNLVQSGRWTAGPVITGLSTSFSTGAAHAMERGAIIQDVSALHVTIVRPNVWNGGVSVSTQVAGLRRLLFGWESGEKETGHWFKQAAEGVVPLVIEVHSADVMASLLIMKAEVEDRIGSTMRMVFSGASEAHLLARELSNEGVGVILTPARPFPKTWQDRRILPGPPLTNDTALVTLLKHGVTVGLGVREGWEARNTRFDLQWAALESNKRIGQHEAYALVTSNLESLLGIRAENLEGQDLVAYERGGVFDQCSKVVGVISPRRELVDLF